MATVEREVAAFRAYLRQAVEDEFVSLRDAEARTGIPKSNFSRHLNAGVQQETKEPPMKFFLVVSTWLHENRGYPPFAAQWAEAVQEVRPSELA